MLPPVHAQRVFDVGITVVLIQFTDEGEPLLHKVTHLENGGSRARIQAIDPGAHTLNQHMNV